MRRAEALSAAISERLLAGFEDAAVGMAVTDPEGRIVWANRALAELLGARVDDLGHRVFSSLFLREESGDDAATDSGSVTEHAIRRPDGSTAWAAVAETPVTESDGALLCVFLLVQDITERVRQLRELDQKSGAIRLLQDIAVAANEARTIQGALQSAVDAVCEFTGWPVGHVYVRAEVGRDVLLPTPIWHLDEPERFVRFRAVTQQTSFPAGFGLPGEVLDTAKPAWTSNIAERADSPRAEAAREVGLRGAFAFPVLVRDEVVGVLEFFSPESGEPEQSLLDVMAHGATQLGRVVERARVEQSMRRLDEARSEFIANAAHELRTPLTTISGFAALLQRSITEMTEEQLEDVLSAMARQGERMRLLVANLLDLSQLELGRLDVVIQEVKLAAVIRESMAVAPPPDGFAVHAAVDDTVKVLADVARLEQVVVNLLTNAYRYAESRAAITVERAGGEVIVTVADDGPGIPDALLTSLFLPFARAANVAKVPGSGLGLAISRRLVETFGGWIRYEPNDPTGARFVLHLRAAR